MLSDDLYLSTHSFLKELAENFPEDTRREQYEAIYHALSKIKFTHFLTITTCTPITDEVLFELFLRRFVQQLERTVIGKRNKSKLPIFSVIERNTVSRNGRPPSLHAHILIGEVIGETRSLQSTTLRHYLQKKPTSALIKILNRLTYPISKRKTGRVGKCEFVPITAQPKVIDYVLKRVIERDLFVAWCATNIDFNCPVSYHSPKCPKGQNKKQRKVHTQSKRSLMVS